MAFKEELSDLSVKKNADRNKQDIGNNKPEALSIKDEFLYKNKVVHIENDYRETHWNPSSACHNAYIECVAIKNEDRKEKQNEPHSKMEEYS